MENSFANGFNLTTTSPVQLEVADTNNLPAWAVGDPNVTLSKITPNNYTIFKKSKTVAPEAAALAGVTVAVLTAGTGSGVGVGIASMAGFEGTAIATGLSHATSAAVSATLSSATTNTLNNDGRIKKGLKQTVSKDGRKSIAMAAVGAGLTGGATEALGIEVDSATLRPAAENNLGQRVGYAAVNTSSKTAVEVGIGGAKVAESLMNNLRSNIADQAQSITASDIGKNYLDGNLTYAEHKLTHAATGGTAALVSGGNIASGALGAVGAEIAGEAAFDSGLLPKTAVDIAKISGAATGLITGDVNTASNSANIASDNNLAPLLAEALLNTIEKTGDIAGIAVTYLDAKTGKIVSTNWNSLDTKTQNKIKGTGSLIGISVSGSLISKALRNQKINFSKTTNNISTIKNLDVAERVLIQLEDSRLKHLKGKLKIKDLEKIIASKQNKWFNDSVTNHINIITEKEGILLRVTLAGNSPDNVNKIISVGPIRKNQIRNGLDKGRFKEIKR